MVWGELAPPAVVASLSAVDVWGFNVYRGTSFTDLWSTWEARSAAPFFLAEFGADSYDGGAGGSDFGMQAAEVTQMAMEVAGAPPWLPGGSATAATASDGGGGCAALATWRERYCCYCQ